MSKFLDLTGLTYFWARIQTILGTKVNRSGDTMTGPLTLSGAPTADLHAATKKYVDDSISNSGGGDMLKAIYDPNDDGIVSIAATVNGFTVGVDVPAGAVFTDTTYNNATASVAGLMSASDYSKLAAFSAASEYALKSDISGVYKYKGSKADYAALPVTGNTVGDVWNTEDTGNNYAWTGSAWDALGGTVTIESVTSEEIDTMML